MSNERLEEEIDTEWNFRKGMARFAAALIVVIIAGALVEVMGPLPPSLVYALYCLEGFLATGIAIKNGIGFIRRKKKYTSAMDFGIHLRRDI